MPASPSSKLPDWYRAIAIVVGVLSIALAFVVLAFPGLALLTLVFLLAFALLVIGVDRLLAGVTGHPWGPVLIRGDLLGRPPDSPPGGGRPGGPGPPT
jgi:hypothetical protein